MHSLIWYRRRGIVVDNGLILLSAGRAEGRGRGTAR